MGRLADSWNLTKASWNVMKQDKELLWMPILSFLASLVAVASIVGAQWAITPEIFTEEGAWSPANTAISLVGYIALAFIGVYFHAAVVAAAHERLEGGDPTVGSGLRKANQHIGKLFLWSLLVATVNLILQAARERGGALGRIAAGIAGVAWNLATFFVVPNLLFSNDGVGGSLKASGRLFKERWGETALGHLGISAAFTVMTIIWVVVAGLLTVLLAGLGAYGLAVGLAILVLGVIVLALVGSVLSAVYKAALYRFAQKGKQEGFPGFDLQHATY